MYCRHLEPLSDAILLRLRFVKFQRTFSINDHQAANLEGTELLHGVVHTVRLVDGEVHVVVTGLLVGIGGEVMIGIFRSGEGTSGGGGNRKHVLGRDGGGCRGNSGPRKCHGRGRSGRLTDDEGCGALGGGGSDSGEHLDVLF